MYSHSEKQAIRKNKNTAGNDGCGVVLILPTFCLQSPAFSIGGWYASQITGEWQISIVNAASKSRCMSRAREIVSRPLRLSLTEDLESAYIAKISSYKDWQSLIDLSSLYVCMYV